MAAGAPFFGRCGATRVAVAGIRRVGLDDGTLAPLPDSPWPPGLSLGTGAQSWTAGRTPASFAPADSNDCGKTGRAYSGGGLEPGGYLAGRIGRGQAGLFRDIVTLGSPGFGGAKNTGFHNLYRPQGIDLG